MDLTEEEKERLKKYNITDDEKTLAQTNHLTVNEQTFVENYMKDCDIKRSFIESVIEAAPNSQTYKAMLKRPNVKKAIEKKKEEFKSQYNLTPERTLQEYVAIALANVKDVFTWEEDGELKMKPIEELTPEQTAAIAEVSVRHDYKSKKDYVSKIKFHNKNTALEALARHLGIFEKDNKQKAAASAEVVTKLLDIIERENKDLAMARKNELIREMHDSDMSIN